jgi:uncharacterized protein
MRRLSTACLLAIPLSVSAANLACAETLLHLGETATITVAPDELEASLRAEAVSPSAAEAQNQVNAAIQDSLGRARQMAGVTVATGGYGVWKMGPTPQDRAERWQASQIIHLTSRDGAKLLSLVGDLQQKGLAVSNLGWRLSREAQRTAHQQATKTALAALRGRIDDAAGLLDLRFDHFKDVRLDSAPPQPAPVMRGTAMPMASPAAAAPPSAAPEDVPVSATAEADAVLLPR